MSGHTTSTPPAQLDLYRDRFEVTQRHAEIGTWELELATQTLWWSPQLYTILHRDPDLGPPSLEEQLFITHPDDLRCFQHVNQQLEQRGPLDPPIVVDHRTHPDLGPIRLLRCILDQRRDADGTPTHLLGTLIDITVLHATESSLRATNHTLSLVLDQAPYFIFIVNNDGNVEYTNRLNHEYTLDLLATDANSYVHPKHRDSVFDALRSAIREQRTTFVEFEDTFQRHYETRFVPVLRNGEVLQTIGFAVETTEIHRERLQRQHLEEQLQHAQKLESLGILAGGIAHDFNNILSAILGHAELAELALQRQRDPNPSLREIIGAAEKATLLCQQLLAYSGRGHFVIRTVDVGQVVSEIASLLAVSVSRRVKLQYHLQPQLPPVRADVSQLQQITMNLITNAAETLGRADGEIHLTTGLQRCERDFLASTWLDDNLPPGDYVFLEVRDTGEGMTPETRARIFDPFFSSKGPGRGLGLAAVLGIVRGHRGALQVETALGEGTTLRVFLPAADLPPEHARTPTPPRPTGPRDQGRHLLVIDDEDAIRRMLTEALETRGHRVTTAPDGLQDLDLFAQHHDSLDAVLLDLTMPRLDGAATLHRLRLLDPDMPVILMSGYTGQEASNLLDGLRAAAFLQKPFRLRELLDALKALPMDRPRTAR